ncbi:PhoH family protein [Parvularcula sp. IMCC14364]|uniref:PhoH family protein n=1 Tax=Parvularcula sp. IMCC14364 TaxID=3067902 RepID=UPI0027415E7A|nr:PhoH family protein [Parvularcula sp. IMCC14364]
MPRKVKRVAGTLAGATDQVTETLDFDDNALVKELCGVTDTNLLLLEQQLDVRIDARGNRLVLTGTQDACGYAREVLMRLYSQLQQGRTITPGDVDAAIRLTALSAPSSSLTAGKSVTLSLPKRSVSPRSATQAAYLNALQDSELVFGVGPAGTGKTYLAVVHAAHMLLRGEVERIILSRPALEAGERIGFLPGDMKEKVDPFLRPLYDSLYDVLHTDFVDRRIASGDIEIAPLAFMRGRTLSRAAVILDEGQNASISQMKMFLTRLGEGSRMVVTGDPSQTDLPVSEPSGLADALSLLKNVEGVQTIRFKPEDVVRHALVARVVKAYDARDKSRHAKNHSKVDKKSDA